jgi:hypothetical protein
METSQTMAIIFASLKHGSIDEVFSFLLVGLAKETQ